MKSYIVMAYKFMEYAIHYIDNIDNEDDIINGMTMASKKFHIRAICLRFCSTCYCYKKFCH